MATQFIGTESLDEFKTWYAAQAEPDVEEIGKAAARAGRVDILEYLKDTEQISFDSQVSRAAQRTAYAIASTALYSKQVGVLKALQNWNYDTYALWLILPSIRTWLIENGFVPRVAAFVRDFQLVKELLDTGLFDDQIQQVLLIAAWEVPSRASGVINTLKYLLDKGIKPTKGAFQAAIDRDNLPVLKMLLTAAPEMAPQALAYAKQSTDKYRYLDDTKPDVIGFIEAFPNEPVPRNPLATLLGGMIKNQLAA